MNRTNHWRQADIKSTINTTFNRSYRETKDAVEASNRTIDAVFAIHGNLSEQELNLVRNGLAWRVDQYTKQFETVGK